MSSNAQKNDSAPSPDKPTATLSESEYLAQQAAAAKAAIASTLGDIKGRLGETIDVRLWTRQHPWITLASAAVAGFAAASTLVPSKEQQALKKLAAIEEALREPRHEREGHDGHSEDGKAPHKGLIGTLIHEAIAALRPILVALMTSGLGGQQQAPQEDPANYGPVPGQPAEPSVGGTPGQA